MSIARKRFRLIVAGALVLLALNTLTACNQNGETATPTATGSQNTAILDMAREKMVTEDLQPADITDPKVLAAMRKVPRHEFVPQTMLNQAYANRPLPIGYGQTISQPYIVALMTQYMEIKPGDKELEIGTGSGYQAAILAELTDAVYSVEIIAELAEKSAKVLEKLGYNIVSKIDDGYYGWEEYGPFDAIIVTAAPDHIPQPLIGQLKEGGRMVIPVGPPGMVQTLWLIEKKDNQILSTNLAPVVFVPLTGDH